MIFRKINKINHAIYSSIEEFKEKNPNLEVVDNWRQGTEGSWVVSDDRQVCQVLKRGKMLNKAKDKITNYYVRVALGTFICADGVRIEGKPRKNLYSFGLLDKILHKESFFLLNM